MKRAQPMPEPTPLSEGGATNVDEQAAAKLLETYLVQRPDDLSVERVWQRLAGKPERRPSLVPSRAFGLLAPSLALCFVVGLGFVLLRRPARPGSGPAAAVTTAPAAELAAARGGVFYSRPAERWQPGQQGQPLAEGQSLRTDASGRAVLDIFGAGSGIASILISLGTDVALERLNGGTYLRLSRGSVVARVSKRPPTEPFVILTHRFSVKVVGTLFRVEQDASDRTLVSVREGVVEVSGADGRSWRVRAGESWSSTSSDQLGVGAIADPVKTLLEDSLRRANPIDLDRELGAMESGAAVESQPPATALAPAASDSIQLAGAGHRAGQEKPSGVRPAGRESLGGSEARPLVPPPVLLAARDPSPAPPTIPAFEPFPAPAPVAASPPATSSAPGAAPVAGSYAEGLALERAGKLEAAAAELARAGTSDPAHGDLALYALGRLRQRRLRDSQGALEAFETYRVAYPKGPLLQEVDLAVLEIEVAAGHRERALAESVRFLSSHPASERIDEVRLLRGDLLRDRGECRAALGEYNQVGAGTFAEEALYETAYCQRKLGDAAGARDSLRLYRSRYPAGTHRGDVATGLQQ